MKAITPFNGYLRNVYKGLAALLSAALFLSGCSLLESLEASSEPEPVTETGLAVTSKDEGPSQGGRLNLFMVAPDSLNPLYTHNEFVRQMSGFLFDSLYAENPEGVYEPLLADTADMSPDNLIADIRLKDPIPFHDGSFLSSDDVVYTVEAIQKVKNRSPYQTNVSNISHVLAVSRLEVRFVLKTPDPNFMKSLTFPILSKKVFEEWPIQGNPENQTPVGTGAFQFYSQDESGIILKRFDKWWFTSTGGAVNDPVWLDEIRFVLYSDKSQWLDAFQRQLVDVAAVEEGDIEGYEKRTDIFIANYKSNWLEYLVLSPVGTVGSPVSDVRIRQILITYLEDYFKWLPEGVDLLYQKPEEDELLSSELGRTEALSALEALGYGNVGGKKIPELTLVVNNLSNERQVLGERMQKLLSEIGINLKLVKANLTDEMKLISTGRYDLMLLGCRMALQGDESHALSLVAEELGLTQQENVLMPLFRKKGAVLYSNRIKGNRDPYWKDIYGGWTQWYMVNTLGNR